jgi:hypothetical protein
MKILRFLKKVWIYEVFVPNNNIQRVASLLTINTVQFIHGFLHTSVNIHGFDNIGVEMQFIIIIIIIIIIITVRNGNTKYNIYGFSNFRRFRMVAKAPVISVFSVCPSVRIYWRGSHGTDLRET